MKQSRRHELKTNELSVFLQQMYAAASRNLNYLIGGVVAVVVVLAVILYVQHRRQQARESAWQALGELQRTSVVEKPAALEDARKLALEQQGSGDLGYRASLLAADMAYQLAMSLDPAKDQEKRLALLRDARDRYQVLIDQNPGPLTVAQARLSLATTEESLLMAGESTREKVRAQYEKLTREGPAMYSDLAADLLATLEERTEPLKIVATRPAEPPATAPATAPATRPALDPDAPPAALPPAAPPATQQAPQAAPAPGTQPAALEIPAPAITQPAAPATTGPGQ